MTTVTTEPMVRARDESYRNQTPLCDPSPVLPDRAAAPSDRPFFIIGVHRSGTTLLRYMLTSSPRVCVPPESDFIVHWFHRLQSSGVQTSGGADAMLTPARVEQLIEQLFTEHRYRLFAREWPGEKPTAKLFCPDGEACTAGAFVERLFATYAARDGAVRWGDKTPIYTSYIGLLHRLIPDARFVHIIRDGRDAALSMVEKWGGSEWHVDLYWAAKNWVRRVRQARAAGTQLGDKLYMELRYEDLVAEPEPHLRRICDFLDEPFEPAMLTPQNAAGKQIERDNPFHRDLHKPVQTTRVARWKEAMSPADRRIVESIAGPLLRELGYECDESSVRSGAALRDRARLAALASKYLFTSTAIRTAQALGLHPVN